MSDEPALTTYSNRQIARFLDVHPANVRLREFEAWIRMVRESERERCAYAIDCMGAIPMVFRGQAAEYLRSLEDPIDPSPEEEPRKTIAGVVCKMCGDHAICLVENGAYCADCEPNAPAGIRVYEHQIRSM